MTTIAFHKESMTIAIDSRTTCSDRVVSDRADKTITRNGVVFAFCGKCCDEELFVDYYFGNNATELLPNTSAFVVDSGVAYSVTISDEGIVQRYRMQSNDAKGSGDHFALAAMDFGCNAKDAVKYAMTRDIYTGGKVKVIKVK